MPNYSAFDALYPAAHSPTLDVLTTITYPMIRAINDSPVATLTSRNYPAEITYFPEYVRVEIDGTRKTNDYLVEMRELYYNVFHACREHGVSKLLTIHRLSGDIPIEAWLKIAERLADLGWDPDFRWASVEMNGSRLQSLYEQTELREKFGIEAEFFADEGDAIDWLLRT